MRDVLIIKLVTGGYKVHVGCQSFFYLTKQAMLLEVSEYLEDSMKAEVAHNSYMSNEGHNSPLAPRGASVRDREIERAVREINGVEEREPITRE